MARSLGTHTDIMQAKQLATIEQAPVIPAQGVTAEQINMLWYIADTAKTLVRLYHRWKVPPVGLSSGNKEKRAFHRSVELMMWGFIEYQKLPKLAEGETPAVSSEYATSDNELTSLLVIVVDAAAFVGAWKNYEKNGTGAVAINGTYQALCCELDVLRAMKPPRDTLGDMTAEVF